MTAETRSFQAQTKKLLDLMIHSIYSHKEIFLRELISNASDAIDKVRFEALTSPELASEWQIRLEADKDARVLRVIDNGVGMSYDEVVEHIGTIAKSGSEQYARKLQEVGKDAASPELIGQFGVGFYSAFMVAERVVLETQKHGETEAVRWESTGDGTYTVERIPARSRGTTITLHLRPREEAPEEGVAAGQDFADPWTIRSLVKKYSDFIAFPIVMENEKWEGEEKKLELETLNSGKALWTRPASQVTAEEHAEFYKHLTHDWNEPGETVHFHAEGAHEWSALLYLPKKAPFDLYSRDPRRGLSLYIKRVFISDEVKELIPEHFRFVRGLVDSADLPLNVSRETVQHDRLLPVIKKRIAGKLVSHLKDVLDKDRPRYEAFWAEFGNCVKEGFHYEPAAKDKLAELVLVHTTAGTGVASLAEVAARKQEGQTALWYLTGDKLEVLQNSPHLEVFRKKGVEVILLPDAVDEIMVGQLDKFGDLELKSAAKGELDGLPDAASNETQPQPAEFEALMTRLKDVLQDEVSEVRLSQRLTDSAVCLVAAEDGMSPQMARMMAAMGQAMPPQKRVLELNGQHAAITALRGMVDSDADRFHDYAEMLLDQALLAEGSPLKNPARFAQRVAAVMARAAGA